MIKMIDFNFVIEDQHSTARLNGTLNGEKADLLREARHVLLIQGEKTETK